MGLIDSCMLVQLHIAVWAARRHDKDVDADVAARAGSKVNKGRFNKSLLPDDAPSYKAVTQAATAMRDWYYMHTLLWNTGSRILSGTHFQTFADGAYARRDTFLRATDVFCAEYPSLRLAARPELNGLWKAGDYPADVRAKFRCNVAYLPVTFNADDFRQTLNDDERRLIEQSAIESIEAATGDAFQRLHKALTAMVTKLHDPDATYRDSLFGNLAELCDVLPGLNITHDARLDAAIDAIRAELTSVPPQTARTDKTVRADTARKAEELAASMAGFFVP
jgi:hypothetical protein